MHAASELRTLSNALLELIRDAEGPLLTTLDDFAFFRGLAPKPAPVPEPVAPPPPVVHAAPPPPPAPKKVDPPPPVIAEAPPPPPKRVEPRSPVEMRAVLKKVAPELAFVEKPPDDAFARSVSERWKTRNQVAPVTVLTFKDSERPLLEAIAKALDVLHGPAKLLDADGLQWETFLSTQGLKWVLITDAALYQLPQLRALYKESPKMLGKIPVFVFPDLSLYGKDPLLKKSLWKALQQALP